VECSEALDFLYESFDGQLTPTQQTLLDAHRRTCFACANTLARAERFQALLLKVPQLAVPRGLEDRIVERVYALSGVTTKRSETWRSFVESFTNWRSFGLAAATAAAAFALVLISRGVIQQAAMNQHQAAATTSLTAAIDGTLDVDSTNGHTQQVGSVIIQPGETLTGGSAQPTTIALSSNLAVTLGSGARIKIGTVSVDARTGDPNVVAVRLDNGTVGVREHLKGNSGAIHVATDQATVVPTGTIFTVTAATGATDVAVGEGSVAVFLPGETFNVLAGSAAHITADKHTVKKLPKGTKLSR
jgi:ferric-dicitrate binding protein FerR (iron transport regulator)